ncbi:class I SAM-dependent methyltransferase [Desulfuribacillus alkaliarsenatis]|uniref:Methyltransferase domain-containing protein n=1 Tax=Desulfuribacillus alkaliarsenatis TaxID=766136 RepID=A0A1E5G3W6_9FIRM|nr:class I SAM-dependent methyltransferase [Desulfuribacillus alkaliarsenatis]OEF97719.1 hypothetical protein BHF68_14065 [Desulfuribacillus alkaliarsenatis]
MTRIKNKVISIDYEKANQFFENRANKYNEKYPYVSTMYQDSNPELTKLRDEYEKNKIFPMLEIDFESKILDVGCGVGRWADLLYKNGSIYLGVDFSNDLLELARKRITTIPGKVEFQHLAAQDIKNNNLVISGNFNRFIITGVLQYLNDADIEKCLQGIVSLADTNSIVYIKETVSIESRLTLNQFYSEELDVEYSAIYRNKEQYETIFEKTLIANGFRTIKRGYLYEDKVLNNRNETMQYFYILERK